MGGDRADRHGAAVAVHGAALCRAAARQSGSDYALGRRAPPASGRAPEHPRCDQFYPGELVPRPPAAAARRPLRRISAAQLSARGARLVSAGRARGDATLSHPGRRQRARGADCGGPHAGRAPTARQAVRAGAGDPETGTKAPRQASLCVASAVPGLPGPWRSRSAGGAAARAAQAPHCGCCRTR